jgi:hypothetical protein
VFGKTVAVYCDDCVTPGNSLCEQNAWLVNFESDGSYSLECFHGYVNYETKM